MPRDDNRYTTVRKPERIYFIDTCADGRTLSMDITHSKK
jgi:hypothetical protein